MQIDATTRVRRVCRAAPKSWRAAQLLHAVMPWSLRMGFVAERTVNDWQMTVLKWICDGCPAGVMTGTTHKTTAIALQGRRLATVSKKGGVWRAEPTDAGRYFVKHGAYPDGHWAASAPEPQEQGAQHHPRPCPRLRTPRPGPKVGALRPTDQMIVDLIGAGGEITVPVPTGKPGHWEGLVSAATRHGKVPDGKLLTIRRGKTWNDRILRLEDPPEWMTVELEPIRVADQLRSPHPVVKALRDDRERLVLKRETRSRALRILDALAKAARAHGYSVAQPTTESGYRHPKGYLKITINGHPNTVDLDELNDRVPHEPTATELREKERHSWKRIPDYDYLPSGRLRLTMLRESAVRQDAFCDTKTINLEDRLPAVLQELELRAAAAEERAQRQERERLERQRQWERVRDEAVVEAREHHRGKVLLRQIERWQQANEIDAYLEAMSSRVDTLPEGDEKAAAGEWLAWARQYRSHIDPLAQPLALPKDPDFTAEVIKPFMGGLSPYGPSGWH